uniref:Putative secreted protein n=1 Tax=Ixodes ricinus TaxID=34613 RepID=A0A6B0ULZ8_IXORI
MAPSRSTAWWWSWTPAAVLCAACTLPSTRSTCSPRCWSTRDTSTWAPTGTLTSDASSFNGTTRSMERLWRIGFRETSRKNRRLRTESSKHSLDVQRKRVSSTSCNFKAWFSSCRG